MLKKNCKRMLCKTTVSNTLTDHRSNWTTEQVISCRDGLFATNRNTFHMFSVFIVMLWHITHKEAEILSCPGYRSNLRRSNWNDIATYSLALFPHATEFVKKKPVIMTGPRRHWNWQPTWNELLRISTRVYTYMKRALPTHVMRV